MARKKTITTDALEKKFDDGEDVLQFFDTDHVQHPNRVQRISLDIPEWMLILLDNEATRLRIPRQAVIKVMLDQSLKKSA